MIELPTGWTSACVGDLGQVVTGSTPSTTTPEYYGGSLPFVRPTDLRGDTIGNTSTSLSELGASVARSVPHGSVLVGCIGSLGKVGLAPKAVAFNQQINAVTPYASCLSKWILFAVLTAQFRQRLLDNSSATTVAIINKSRFSSVAILVAPLNEQRRIVEAIESYFTRLDDAVASLERVQRNLKRYRASVLKAAVEGRLVPTEAELARADDRDYEPASVLLERILTERRRRWEEAELAKMNGKVPRDDVWKAKYEEPVETDTSGLPALPEGWCWASVGQLGEVVTGTTPSTRDQSLYGKEVPFFKPTDLDAGYNVVNARQFLSHRGAEHARVLPAESVLVTCIGATIGKTGLARVTCATNQQINALVPEISLRASRYLFWFFCSPFGQRHIIENASSTTLPILNKSRFEQLPVPLPPLAEQKRILVEVERIDSVKRAVAESNEREQQRVSRLRQSILKWAFEGRLVDQDPTDEPASVLLERIKSERAAKPVRSPTRRLRQATSQRTSS